MARSSSSKKKAVPRAQKSQDPVFSNSNISFPSSLTGARASNPVTKMNMNNIILEANKSK